MSGSALDRRTFLGSLSLAGAGLFAGWPALSLGSTPATAPGSWMPACDDVLREVDDMWGHWPRYAHPIPHGDAQTGALPWEQIDPVDRIWAAWS
jgi:hypothetical protein